MFSSLIYLALVLFLLIEAPVGGSSSLGTILSAAATYFLALFIIYFLPKRKRLISYHLSQLITLSSLSAIFYLFQAQGGASLFLTSIIGLLLYLAALTLYNSHVNTFSRAKKQLRFLIPFTLPYLLLVTLPPQEDSAEVITLYVILTALCFCFIPWLLQLIWGCTPLYDEALRIRLEALCNRTGFQYAGLKTWTVMNHAYTAAIIGVLPKLRYIIFTKALIDNLPVESIETILAHEIGHSRYKHLYFYPFIIIGLPILLLFFDQLITVDSPILSVLLIMMISALYFRFVFGYFSRQFERQADLYPLEVGLDPHHLIGAFSALSRLTRTPLAKPNWHHFGLQERIDFLHKVIRNPDAVASHHRKVKVSLIAYFFLFLLLLAAISFTGIGIN